MLNEVFIWIFECKKMAAILFICLVKKKKKKKDKCFLCYYKMLNLGQSGLNSLKDDQIKNIQKQTL